VHAANSAHDCVRAVRDAGVIRKSARPEGSSFPQHRALASLRIGVYNGPMFGVKLATGTARQVFFFPFETDFSRDKGITGDSGHRLPFPLPS